MKFIIFIFLLVPACQSFSQEVKDTLFHLVDGLGSEKFILYSDKNFKYVSNMCGSTYCAYGTYKHRFGRYKFISDTTACPLPKYRIINNENKTDSLKITYLSVLDSSKIDDGPYIRLKSEVIFPESSEFWINKIKLLNNQLQLYMNNNPIFVSITENSQEIIFYLEPDMFAYSCGPVPYNLLKKTKLGYRMTHVNFDENKEKPWKRGKKRKRSYYFVSRMTNSKKS